MESSKKDIFFYGTFGASALLVVCGSIWAWVALRGIQTPLVLHFSDYTGINQIGGIGEISGIGLTALVVIAMNFFLSRALRARDPRLAQVLAGATLIVAVLIFVALAAIISVNQ